MVDVIFQSTEVAMNVAKIEAYYVTDRYVQCRISSSKSLKERTPTEGCQQIQEASSSDEKNLWEVGRKGFLTIVLSRFATIQIPKIDFRSPLAHGL